MSELEFDQTYDFLSLESEIALSRSGEGILKSTKEEKMTKPNVNVRTKYSQRVRPILDCSKDKLLTEQHHAKDCDINTIVERNLKQGYVPPINQNPALYGDFSSVPSYQEALNTVLHAQDQFASLEAHVRARFSNDPVQLLQFMEKAQTDKATLEEAGRLGLVEIKEIEKPSPSSPSPSPQKGKQQKQKDPESEDE
uniref:Minor capsid protein n=1 Tax=Gokushovirinae environmental samples TaxID=1478972 RepID=A0A2R3UAE6_9VIRU|nr:minor capsid protein [Gokushovirinae environmental samples]